MKKKVFLIALLAIFVACSFISCQKEIDELSGKTIVIKDNGTTSNGSRFVGIDDKNFYLDYIKYTVDQGHLIVSGYDKEGFKGVAKIASAITYKGNAYEVLGIGKYAFRNCTSLTSVTIPNGVTSIGIEAFSDCTDLTSTTIGNGVTVIGFQAFSGCTSLTSVTIPNGVKNINERAFFNCKEMTSITIGSGVTDVGPLAFSGCTGLTSIHCKPTIPPTLTLWSNIAIIFVDPETYEKATLYVPKGCSRAYKAADGWGNFVHIEEK